MIKLNDDWSVALGIDRYTIREGTGTVYHTTCKLSHKVTEKYNGNTYTFKISNSVLLDPFCTSCGTNTPFYIKKKINFMLNSND